MIKCTCKAGCRKCYGKLSIGRLLVIYVVSHIWARQVKMYLGAAPVVGETMTLDLGPDSSEPCGRRVPGLVVKARDDGTFKVRIAVPTSDGAGSKFKYARSVPRAHLSRTKPRFPCEWADFVAKEAQLLGGRAEVC